jgi:hypothetical protein
MLDALDTLETQPTTWRFDTTKERLIFNDENTRQSYNKSIVAMNAAVEEQLKLQSRLLSIQHAQR